MAQVEQVEDETVQELVRLNEHLTERAQQLETALQTRIVIEQAKGMLAGRHGLEIDDAFDVLRRAARSNRVRIHDLAQRVVSERQTPEEITHYLR